MKIANAYVTVFHRDPLSGSYLTPYYSNRFVQLDVPNSPMEMIGPDGNRIEKVLIDDLGTAYRINDLVTIVSQGYNNAVPLIANFTVESVNEELGRLGHVNCQLRASRIQGP